MIARYKIVSLLMLALLTLSISHCAPRRADTLPGNALQISAVEREELAARVFSHCSEVQRYRALARARIEYDGEAQRLRYVLVGELPTRLRVEILPDGALIAIGLLAIDDQKVLLLDAQERVAYLRRSPRAALASVLRVPLGVEELLAYLAGRLPCAYRSSIKTAYRLPQERIYQLVLNDGDIVAAIDPDSSLLTELKQFSHFNGEALLTMSFGNYRAFDGVTVPIGIDMTLPRDGVSARFDLSAIRINGPSRPELFAPPIPKDYKRDEQEEDSSV